MRSCPVCGASVGETDDFCGNCGSYLGWSSKAAAPPESSVDTEQPVAVQPAKPVAPRPTVRPSAASGSVEGPPCPVCGTTNPPDRNFCRHCATPLRPAAVAETKVPWWRKIWPFRRRVRARDTGRVLRRIAALVVLIAVVIAVFLLFPFGRNAVEDLRDKLGHASPIAPLTVTANAEVPGHPAAAAADGLTNRYWGAPAVGDSVTFTFPGPFRLVDIVAHTGASTAPEQFQQEARATKTDLVITTSDGSTKTQSITLGDTPGPQTFQLGVTDVVSIRLVIRSAAGLTPGRHIALGELEFFRRS